MMTHTAGSATEFVVRCTLLERASTTKLVFTDSVVAMNFREAKAILKIQHPRISDMKIIAIRSNEEPENSLASSE
jgi:hypothetical protein